MEIMGGKHTFYGNIYCHSFCEARQTKKDLVQFIDAFPSFPFLYNGNS